MILEYTTPHSSRKQPPLPSSSSLSMVSAPGSAYDRDAEYGAVGPTSWRERERLGGRIVVVPSPPGAGTVFLSTSVAREGVGRGVGVGAEQPLDDQRSQDPVSAYWEKSFTFVRGLVRPGVELGHRAKDEDESKGDVKDGRDELVKRGVVSFEEGRELENM